MLSLKNWSLPRMSDCGNHFPIFTLLGFPGNESVSHFQIIRCLSFENASTNACLLISGMSELYRPEPILK